MFEFQGHKFNYCDHPHNNTSVNERRVEVPLIGYFLDKYSDCVEIGAVSPYYFEGNHEVYDLTDSHPRSKSARAENIDISGLNLLSISTIEHCSVPDFFCSDDDSTVAPLILDNWMRGAKRYLISWPIGYAPFLDQHAMKNYDCKFIARRPYSSHDWKQVTLEDLTETDKIYGSFSCANAVLILENIF